MSDRLPVMNVRMDPILLKKLKKFAEEDRRSFSNLVRVALEDYVVERERAACSKDAA